LPECRYAAVTLVEFAEASVESNNAAASDKSKRFNNIDRSSKSKLEFANFFSRNVMYKGKRDANRRASLQLPQLGLADCGNGKVKKCAEVLSGTG
jgi:hypothetical protein